MAHTKALLLCILSVHKVHSAVGARLPAHAASLSGVASTDRNLDFVSPLDIGGSLGIFFSKDGRDEGKKRPQPLNVIFSGRSSFGPYNNPFGSFKNSDQDILLQENGFSQYLSALDFSDECRGIHTGGLTWANISSARPSSLEAHGQKRHAVTEPMDLLYRDNHKDHLNGTCEHHDGFHFRGWRQKDSGAWFLDASQTYTLRNGSTAFKANGWDLGRDELVRRALKGGRDFKGCSWPPATVEDIVGLIEPDAGGPSSAWAHEVGTDGIVKLITVGIPSCRHESRSKEQRNHRGGLSSAQTKHSAISGAGPPREG